VAILNHVHDVRPTFHGHTLEDYQHSTSYVVKVDEISLGKDLPWLLDGAISVIIAPRQAVMTIIGAIKLGSVIINWIIGMAPTPSTIWTFVPTTAKAVAVIFGDGPFPASAIGVELRTLRVSACPIKYAAPQGYPDNGEDSENE
jgi:hypothetical protein